MQSTYIQIQSKLLDFTWFKFHTEQKKKQGDSKKEKEYINT